MTKLIFVSRRDFIGNPVQQNSSKIPIRISVGQAAGYAYSLKTDAAKIILDTVVIR